jgi:hypothetical protein
MDSKIIEKNNTGLFFSVSVFNTLRLLGISRICKQGENEAKTPDD